MNRNPDNSSIPGSKNLDTIRQAALASLRNKANTLRLQSSTKENERPIELPTTVNEEDKVEPVLQQKVTNKQNVEPVAEQISEKPLTSQDSQPSVSKSRDDTDSSDDIIMLDSVSRKTSGPSNPPETKEQFSSSKAHTQDILHTTLPNYSPDAKPKHLTNLSKYLPRTLMLLLSHTDTTLRGAIFDLRRLGLSFDDVVAKSQVDPSFAESIYKSMGYPVSRASKTSSKLQPSSAEIPKPTKDTNELKELIKEKMRLQKQLSQLSKLQSSQSTSAAATPYASTPLSFDLNPTPKFGSDRWSSQLNLEISDEEEDDDDEKNEKEDGEDHDQDMEDTNEIDISSGPETIRNRADSGLLSAKGSNTPSASALHEKLEEIKRVSALLESMQKKKAEESHKLVPVKEKSRRSSAVKIKVDPVTKTAEPILASASSIDVPVDKVSPSLKDTPPVSSTSHVLESKKRDALQLERRLELALLSQQQVSSQAEVFEKELNDLSVASVESEVEALKNELEQKMKKLYEMTVKSVSVKAHYESIKQQELQARKEVQELEELLKQTRRDIEESNNMDIEVNLDLPLDSATPIETSNHSTVLTVDENMVEIDSEEQKSSQGEESVLSEIDQPVTDSISEPFVSPLEVIEVGQNSSVADKLEINSDIDTSLEGPKMIPLTSEVTRDLSSEPSSPETSITEISEQIQQGKKRGFEDELVVSFHFPYSPWPNT